MIVGLVACTTLSSCLESSLDTNPTDSMSGSGLLANANAALVPLNGLTVPCIQHGLQQIIHTNASVSVLTI